MHCTVARSTKVRLSCVRAGSIAVKASRSSPAWPYVYSWQGPTAASTSSIRRCWRERWGVVVPAAIARRRRKALLLAHVDRQLHEALLGCDQLRVRPMRPMRGLLLLLRLVLQMPLLRRHCIRTRRCVVALRLSGHPWRRRMRPYVRHRPEVKAELCVGLSRWKRSIVHAKRSLNELCRHTRNKAERAKTPQTKLSNRRPLPKSHH
jgi:hypothetical protein